MKSIYSDNLSEQAFRTWQAKFNQCLITNWTVTDKEMSFDKFCLARYTGRLNFKLREN